MLGMQTLYTMATGRSGKWPKVRDAYLAANPKCVVCGQKADTIHHIRPVHVAPALELDEHNFASVCDADHFAIGHVCNWRLWNDNFWGVVNLMNRGRRGPAGEP